MTNKDSVGYFHTANFLNMYDSMNSKLHMQLELLNFCSCRYAAPEWIVSDSTVMHLATSEGEININETTFSINIRI